MARERARASVRVRCAYGLNASMAQTYIAMSRVSPHSAFPRKISQQQHFTLCIRHTTLWAPFMVKTHTPFFDSARAFALTTLAAMLIPTVLQSSTNVSSRIRARCLYWEYYRPNFHSREQLSLFWFNPFLQQYRLGIIAKFVYCENEIIYKKSHLQNNVMALDRTK